MDGTMVQVVTGGSGSGKSEYAESLALSLGRGPRLYLATMRVWDEEGRRRVERHRAMREGKGFITVERYTDLRGWAEQADRGGKPPVILLECMSNLVANEFYLDKGTAAERILGGNSSLRDMAEELIIVTNEVFSDGRRYDTETEEYIRLLGAVNCALGRMADTVTEVVCGLPLLFKVVE